MSRLVVGWSERSDSAEHADSVLEERYVEWREENESFFSEVAFIGSLADSFFFTHGDSGSHR